MEITSFRGGQQSQYIRMNTTYANETFLMAYFDFVETYVNPIYRIYVTRWTSIRTPVLQLFNASIRVCDMERFSSRNPFIKAFTTVAQKMSNVTLTCPLKAGMYFVKIRTGGLRNIFPLRLLYQSDSYLTVHLALFNEVQKGNLTFLADYLINSIVTSDC